MPTPVQIPQDKGHINVEDIRDASSCPEPSSTHCLFPGDEHELNGNSFIMRRRREQASWELGKGKCPLTT